MIVILSKAKNPRLSPLLVLVSIAIGRWNLPVQPKCSQRAAALDPGRDTYGFLADFLPTLNIQEHFLVIDDASAATQGSRVRAMRQMAMHHVWIDGYRAVGAVRVDSTDRTEGIARRLWKYGWGLLLVLVMTVLSEYGPRMAYSKVASDVREVSQPIMHSIK